MFQFYARTMLISLLLLIILSVAMLAIGSAQPLHPALRGFVEGCEDTESLCWYGIVSYETSLEAAREILTRNGFSLTDQSSFQGDAFFSAQNLDFYERPTQEGCNQIHLAYPPNLSNPEVIITDMNNCEGLYIADILEIFGTPEYVHFFNDYNGEFIFDNGIMTIYKGKLEPYAPVRYIWFNYFGAGGGGLFFEWRGFLPLWRYCLPRSLEQCW